jgi:hydrogenase maturation protein HypF
VVQGVGFRPFVHGLATELGLGGFVRNETSRVVIEVEGASHAVQRLVTALGARPPPLAEIRSVEVEPLPPSGQSEFHIAESHAGAADVVLMAPDTATCAACFAEMRDPSERRHRYPFTNCTECGPRLSIITGAPYDRRTTTMNRFVMCVACQREYSDPRDRRFHAEPIACPSCGPRLVLLDEAGRDSGSVDPIAAAADRIARGEICALKGLGGYQLACDARSEDAVSRLRQRKHREQKPFAILVRRESDLAGIARATPVESALLSSRERPIVLLRRAGTGVADSVAPGLSELGVMLPYTPLHDLLLESVGNIPLVMTSGNRSDEPMVTDDQAALSRLRGIADCFLVHDRDIFVRVDDSVMRVIDERPLLVRRARGHAPRAIQLPLPLDVPTLAVGGQLKNTFALGVGFQAILSAHIGDLDELSAQHDFDRMLQLYLELFRVTPERVVCDLHPDYASTEWARRFAAERGIEVLSVQHHHAHFASCLADAASSARALCIAFDGMGHGSDGAAWGGEILLGSAARSERALHLRYVGLPGGDRAALEPWRMAVAHCMAAGVDHRRCLSEVPSSDLRNVERLIEREVSCPRTSSVGRLFDAVAALVGVTYRAAFEGQAAMLLEALAEKTDPADALYPFEIAAGEIDPTPAVRAIVADIEAGASPARVARGFHESLALAAATACAGLRDRFGVDHVALSGGVFVNRVLTSALSTRLHALGFGVLRHRQVPPNDGGLSLGQLHAVAARDAARRTCA